MFITLLTFVKEYPFLLAFLLGLIPALIWLWFWLKEDIHPEPPKMVTLSFLGGMLAVLLVLPLQRLVYELLLTHSQGDTQTNLSFFLWAALEEIFKFGMVYVIALRNKCIDEPVDDIIYLIISALGFVTMENTLFLIEPIHTGDIFGTIITENLRFVGASLLHVIASATIGICMGLAFYKSPAKKKIYLGIGLCIAIVLHTAFNLSIINQAEGNIFFVFGAVWIGIIALLILFEKVKHINPPNNI